MHAIAADAARVQERDVGAGLGAQRIGEQITQIRLGRAQPERLGLQRHARDGDDGVELCAEARFVGRHDLRSPRLLGEGARDRNQLVEPLGEQSPTPIPSIRATHLASDPA